VVSDVVLVLCGVNLYFTDDDDGPVNTHVERKKWIHCFENVTAICKYDDDNDD